METVRMETFEIRDTALKYRHNRIEDYHGEHPHYRLFDEVMHFLGQIGFYVSKDKEVEKNYKPISKYHKQGRYADLEFKSQKYPSGFDIVFYQNVVFENRHGGYYDFNKLEKMPYLVKKQFLLTIKKLSEFLKSQGVEDKTEPTYKTAEDKIKAEYVRSWHHPQKDMNFSLSDLDGTNNKGLYCIDRDGKEIHNGDIKYSRDWNGYLIKGRVYQDINTNWIMILNKSDITYISCHNLFDLSENDSRCRVKRAIVPTEYLSKRECLSRATNKELLRELRRRNVIKKGKISK